VAYCGINEYLTHSFSGTIADFQVTKVIYNKSHDAEGFVGFLPSQKSIYVSFRGSESFSNWYDNLDALKTKYTTYPECEKCNVHSGFYSATLSVSPDVIAEVSRLKAFYPNYQVKTTGHSLGGAMAHLIAMELIKVGFQTTMINFG
jgi:predicted lipase